MTTRDLQIDIPPQYPLKERVRDRILAICQDFLYQEDTTKKLFLRDGSSPFLVLFADLKESTASWASEQGKALLKTLRHHFAFGAGADEIRSRETTIENSHGSSPVKAEIIKTVGDEIILGFWLDSADETTAGAVCDMIRRVVTAAIEARSYLDEKGIRTKIAIHLCTEYVNALEAVEAIESRPIVWPRAELYFQTHDILGHHMNVAARILSSCQAGDVLVSKAAVERVHSLCWSPIALSTPLEFQGWRGLENQERDQRTAFSVAFNTAPDFRWPFHAVAYVVSQGNRRPVTLATVFAAQGVRPNLVDLVDVSCSLRVVRKPKNNLKFIAESNICGVIRAVADSFESYNQAMETSVYSTNDLLTYSSGLFFPDTQHNDSTAFQEQLNKSRRVQPNSDRDWSDCVPRGEWVGLALFKTGLVNTSRKLMAGLVEDARWKAIDGRCSPYRVTRREVGLLFGEWDVFVLFEVQGVTKTTAERALLAIARVMVKGLDELVTAVPDTMARFFLGRQLSPKIRRGT